jgi:predicted acetyltransferase
MELSWPSLDRLPDVADALRRGWTPDHTRGEAAAREALARIGRDAAGYVASLVDREAKGPPVGLPDGTTAPRLPGYVRWIWDGAFCGFIGFRWQPGTTELPPHVLGHIGYSGVPWQRCRGVATRALRLQLPDCAREGLPHVFVTTDPGNVASRRVIERNGGVLVERFVKPVAFGSAPGLRYRIDLAEHSPAPTPRTATKPARAA